MSRALGLLCTLLMAYGWQQPAIPDTQPGKTLQAWLEAFNSGDRGRIEAYFQKYEPSGSVDGTMAFRNQTGGFELLSIDKSEPKHIAFRVKEKASTTVALGKIDLKDAEPAIVANFSLRAIPAGATMADLTLDAAARSRVIDGAVARLNEFYVFPDIAAKMGDSLRERQKKGEYDAVTEADKFASMLTEHLREISKDKHLRVNYNPFVLPPPSPGQNTGGPAQFQKQMERINCGFEKAERLSPNTGYLKFNMFANPDVCGTTAIIGNEFPI